MTSVSIKKCNEQDFLELKKYLKDNRYSMSDYIIHCWKIGMRMP